MELVSASEAAKRLGVHPSQITRGIQSGLIKDHAPAGLGRPMIDVEQARAARQQGLDRSKLRGARSLLLPLQAAAPDVPGAPEPLPPLQMAQQAPPPPQVVQAPMAAQEAAQAPVAAPAGLPAAAAAPAGPSAAAAAPAGPPAVAADRDDEDRDPSYQASRARRESAAATRAEIELAQLRGKTLDRAEVADAAYRLGQMLREGMETRRVALAQRLVGLDAAGMIGVLADADEMHLAALADAIERDIAGEETRVAA